MPQKSLDEQLSSLKERLKSVSYQPDNIDGLQGTEIIRTAINYLNNV
ncbi:hypothetical protein V5J35_000454 [Endozoicomonas sp. NE40]|uniref:Uncharacterized protein n=1 Tax=Endozoicomonas lisbonensis TaxID=3120522 RepID=A0ABV2SBW7_9GAMM